MNKDKYSGEVYLELTFWSNVRHTQLACPVGWLTSARNRKSNLTRSRRLGRQRFIRSMEVPDLLHRLEAPAVTCHRRCGRVELGARAAHHPRAIEHRCTIVVDRFRMLVPYRMHFAPRVLLRSSVSTRRHTRSRLPRHGEAMSTNSE